MRFGLSIHPYSVFMIISSLVSLLLASWAWFGTRKKLSRSFALLETAIFIWSVFSLVRWEALSPFNQYEALQLQYLGIAFIPGFSYMFARALAGRPSSGLGSFLILAPCMAFFALVSTNELHHLFWIDDGFGFFPANPSTGWGFWAFIAYAYALSAISIAMMIRIAAAARGMLSRWLKRLVTLFVLPLATNAVYVFFLQGVFPYDPTPVVFACSGIVLTLALRQFNFLDVVPYAKEVILASIDTPILAIDAEGFVIGANAEARRLFSDAEVVEGRTIAELVPELSGLGADRAQREWSRGGVPFLVSCYTVKQGGLRWRGRIFLFREISAMVEARREVESARARADAASAAKSAFVATVSHELRNPLNAIIGLAELDLGAAPPPGLKEDLEVILSSGNILLGLVNDLLDLSKIEAGKMELEKVDFDLHDKALSILRAFRPIIEKKGIFLDISIAEGTPRFVRGDPLRYGQVLMNLVSNAIKFTEHGAISVDLAPVEVLSKAGVADPRGLCVLTRVLDSGMGIAPEKLPKLFQEFSQADSSIGRRFGGTGLGLSICKKLVGLFGGEISVDSVEGAGSAFGFTARFESGEEAKARSAPLPELALSGGRSLDVLVVDDDPINGAVAKRYLERLGHKVSIANTGSQALERLRRESFDLVLLDLGLPDMDGFEANRLIRAEALERKGAEPPVAAMTARAESGVRAACATAGMIDCLPKPLDHTAIGRLLTRVATSVRELGPRAAASVQAARSSDAAGAAPPRRSLPGTPLIDEPALLERLDGDDSFVRELLGIFIDEAPGRREAFAAAVSSRNLAVLQRLGHALKGSSLSLCAKPLGSIAGAIEIASMKAIQGEAVSEDAYRDIAIEVDELIGILSDTVDAARALL